MNDASLPLLPNCHPWFNLDQHRGKKGQTLALKDYSLRQDQDIHPASTRLAGNQKTGFLGGWTYGIHCGLDLQLKTGTKIFCVTDGGEWRGYQEPDGPTQNKDSLHYVVPRPDGWEWWFGSSHCSRVKAIQGQAMKAGELFALSGRERAGIPHAHTSVRIRKDGRFVFHLNPWPVLWQGLENLRAARGLPCARILPLSPVAPGQEVSFQAGPTEAGTKKELEYSWCFDDGTRQSGARAAKSFQAPGMHQVILRIGNLISSDRP